MADVKVNGSATVGNRFLKREAELLCDRPKQAESRNSENWTLSIYCGIIHNKSLETILKSIILSIE